MYRYAEVEAALAKVHMIRPDSMGAFRGRIKHLQKIGIVPSSPGKGKRISYEFADVAVWAFCLQLSEFGIDPTVTKTIWHQINSIVMPHLIDESKYDKILMFAPSLVSSSHWQSVHQVYEIVDRSQANYELFCSNYPPPPIGKSDPPRLGMINITHIRRELQAALPDQSADS